MARRKKKTQRKTSQQTVEKSLSLSEIDEKIIQLNVQKNLTLEKAMTSNDVEEIIKASNYLEKQKNTEIRPKAQFFLPEDYFHTGQGYKETLKGVSFDVLQRMGSTFISKAVVNTRIEQIQRFLTFTTDDQKEGYTITRKRGPFESETQDFELSREDKRKIEYLVKFLENGGETSKWDSTYDFHDFVRMIMRDSLVLDQLAFELVRNRGGKLVKFIPVDASLVRFLDTVDPRYQEDYRQLKKGNFYPQYGMVWNNQIIHNPITNVPSIFYPWEMGFGIRNRTTNVRTNHYGVSEMEVLIEIVTWILWGMQYNGNFFKQGSQPKGFLNIKGQGGLGNTTLNDFRNSWRQMMTSVENSHKIPVFEGIDMEWVDLQKNNRDMEFQTWVEFLITLFCSVYTIDPSELGYHFKRQSDLFGQGGQRERLDHSKKKGLSPLLRFLEKIINRYIIEEIYPEFEFKFTGVEPIDRELQAKVYQQELMAGVVPFEHAFEQRMGRAYDPEKDTILNPQMIQMKQMEAYGNPAVNEVVDEESRKENNEEDESKSRFKEVEKSFTDNPIAGEAIKLINKLNRNEH